jgi:hypothetical protein
MPLTIRHSVTTCRAGSSCCTASPRRARLGAGARTSAAAGREALAPDLRGHGSRGRRAPVDLAGVSRTSTTGRRRCARGYSMGGAAGARLRGGAPAARAPPRPGGGQPGLRRRRQSVRRAGPPTRRWRAASRREGWRPSRASGGRCRCSTASPTTSPPPRARSAWRRRRRSRRGSARPWKRRPCRRCGSTLDTLELPVTLVVGERDASSARSPTRWPSGGRRPRGGRRVGRTRRAHGSARAAVDELRRA